MKEGDVFQYKSPIFSYKYRVLEVNGNTAMIEVIDGNDYLYEVGHIGKISVNGPVRQYSRLVKNKSRHPLTNIFINYV